MKAAVIELPLTLCSSQGETDLSRRRYQNPQVFREGNYWKLRVYEDALDANGKRYRARPQYIVGPCVGPGAMTERQARKEAQDRVLKTLNNYVACPSSVMSLEAFVAQKFQPDVVDKCKKAGREHYKYGLSKILPGLGSLKLRDLQAADIRRFLDDLERKGLSPKTLKHIRTTLTTIFNHAKTENYFSGDNPASKVRLVETQSPERYAYSFEEAQVILSRLASPVAEMVLASMLTSMNVAELCGLLWKRINLTSKTVFSAGEAIPPCSALVRENFYRNTRGTVKSKARRRTVGLPLYLVERLVTLKDASPFAKPDDPVFSSRNGTPLDAHNINSRLFKKVSGELELPVTWHIFRHSAATFCEALGMPLSDREKLLGHSKAQMTQHYTHSDVQRRLAYQEQLADRIIPERDRRMRELMKAHIEGPKQ